MNPRRILFVGDNFGPHMARLAAAVSRAGCAVTVWDGEDCLRQVPERPPQLQTATVRAWSLRGNSRPLIRRFQERLNAARVWRCVRRTGAELVHFLNLSCHGLPGDYWRDELPLVATAFGSDVDDTVIAKHQHYELVRERVLTSAAVVTGDSTCMIDRCRALVPGKPEECYRLIRWGVDTTRFNLASAQRGRRVWRERLGIPADGWVILSQRNTRPNYRIELILAAFELVLKEQPATLVIKTHRQLSEADADYLRRLEERAAPCAEHVRFVGSVAYEELAEFYATADVAVSVPAADGAPASFLELMALGVPVVAGNLPDYADLLTAEETGVLVDDSSPQRLAGALLALHADPARRRGIAERAAAFAHGRGSWGSSVEQFLAAYRAAVKR